MKIPIIGKENEEKFEVLPPAPEVHAETSPAEIDAKRAAHILDRATQLAERGDLSGAIVAARQAISLDHDSAGAHESLGNYLERSGDLAGARTAYGRALELAPQSALNKASLERIEERISHAQNGASGAADFSFDDAELTDFSKKNTGAPTAIAATGAASETTPFDQQLDGAAPHVDAKLPPTRAELEAAQTSAAIDAVLPPTSQEVAAKNPEIATKDVAAIDFSSFFAAIPAPSVSDPAPSFDSPASASAIDAKLPPTTAAASAAPAVPAPQPFEFPDPERRAASDRRQKQVPVATERRSGGDRRVAQAGSPFVFQPVFDEPKAPLWAQYLRQPSFYGRTLPLVLLTVFSLGFLTWARARAISQSAQNPTVIAANPALVPTDPAPETVPNPGAPNSGTTPPALSNAANPNDGFTITNNPNAAQSVPAPSLATNPVGAAPPTAPNSGTNTNANANTNARPSAARPAAANRPAGGGNGNNRPRTSSAPPRFPSASLAPAPIPPSAILEAREAARNRAGADDNTRGGGELGLPAPQIPQNVPAEPPVRVLPPGSPLNAGGAANRGYVRVQSGQLGAASAPRRPQNQANQAEQAATNAARGGQTDQAIQNLTSSLNSNASDSGFRLQQRAGLFLERGDYGRAIDDFQAAISAYQDQIERGENVSAARSGLRSARSGLNVALAARRNGGN